MSKVYDISVLIVEDNPPMLELAKSIFLTFGVGEVIAAVNGEDGFKKFCKFKPDIVIADWMMSPMDGIEMTRRIRNDRKSPNTTAPVILMTSYSEQRRAEEARDAGITDFLVKPFNTRDMYRRVIKVLDEETDFVRSMDYFGPDRRRKQTGFGGPDRRGGFRVMLPSLSSDTKTDNSISFS